jgi:hypothetical protein
LGNREGQAQNEAASRRELIQINAGISDLCIHFLNVKTGSDPAQPTCRAARMFCDFTDEDRSPLGRSLKPDRVSDLASLLSAAHTYEVALAAAMAASSGSWLRLAVPRIVARRFAQCPRGASRAPSRSLGHQSTDTTVEHRSLAPSLPWAGRSGEGRSGSKVAKGQRGAAIAPRAPLRGGPGLRLCRGPLRGVSRDANAMPHALSLGRWVVN